MRYTGSSTRFRNGLQPLAVFSKATPILGILLLGLFADVLRHDEASGVIEYGYALVALFATVSCMGYLALRLQSRLMALPSFGVTRLTRAASASDGDAPGEDWPLLISLLFGPLIVLLAGLGGWV